MKGYEIDVQSDVHRRNLIKDSRFYNLRHLTESLTPSKTYHNPFRGNTAEILISIKDFRPSNSRIGWVEGQPFGWMEYKRPHDIDKESRDLVIQIDDDGIIVGGGKIVLINRQALKAVKAIKESAEGRKSETHPAALSVGRQEMAIRIEIPNECYCLFDGEERSAKMFDSTGPPLPPPPVTAAPENAEDLPSKKRKLSDSIQEESGNQSPKAYTLKRSMWRVKVKGHPPPEGGTSQSSNQPVVGDRRALVFVGVKLEGWSGEKEFSKEISWL
jgi:hypothetical protein